MKILTDIHTHTVASSHAHSTLLENIQIAKEKGFELLAMTNHGPALSDGANILHFFSLRSLPRIIKGVKMLYGVELNIKNADGEIDLPEEYLRKMGIVIASLHSPTYTDKALPDHTKTWLNVLKNPYVNILGHIGRGHYPFDHEAVVKAAKEADVLIEVNRYTLENPNFSEVCRDVVLKCKKFGAKIVIGSDAHFCEHVGSFTKVESFLSELDFPEELIVSRDADTLISHLKNKNKHFDYSF